MPPRRASSRRAATASATAPASRAPAPDQAPAPATATAPAPVLTPVVEDPGPAQMPSRASAVSASPATPTRSLPCCGTTAPGAVGQVHLGRVFLPDGKSVASSSRFRLFLEFGSIMKVMDPSETASDQWESVMEQAEAIARSAVGAQSRAFKDKQSKIHMTDYVLRAMYMQSLLLVAEGCVLLHGIDDVGPPSAQQLASIVDISGSPSAPSAAAATAATAATSTPSAEEDMSENDVEMWDVANHPLHPIEVRYIWVCLFLLSTFSRVLSLGLVYTYM